MDLDLALLEQHLQVDERVGGGVGHQDDAAAAGLRVGEDRPEQGRVEEQQVPVQIDGELLLLPSDQLDGVLVGEEGVGQQLGARHAWQLGWCRPALAA